VTPEAAVFDANPHLPLARKGERGKKKGLPAATNTELDDAIQLSYAGKQPGKKYGKGTSDAINRGLSLLFSSNGSWGRLQGKRVKKREKEGLKTKSAVPTRVNRERKKKDFQSAKIAFTHPFSVLCPRARPYELGHSALLTERGRGKKKKKELV